VAPGRFERAVRAWLEEAQQRNHPLADYWIRDHLERVALVRRLHLPLFQEQRNVAGVRALDLGCGTAGAGVALALADASVTGVDVSERLLGLAAIRAAEEGARLALVRGDARHLPFCGAAFDLCVCDQVIEHVERYTTLLAEAHRVLRPGGLLFVSAPHRLAFREGHTALLFASWLPHRLAGRYAAWRGRRMPDEPWDVWLELPWTIRRRLRQAGFEELRSPWRQSRRPQEEGTRLRRALARIGPLVQLVHWGFRWYGFLFGTVTFLLRKLDRPEEVPR
jgi:ubiquinone/menaquinone biosynthesis C-methylase UbiE